MSDDTNNINNSAITPCGGKTLDDKIDIVLDLDNTLICAIDIHRKKKYNYRYTIMPETYKIYHRPYLQEFLDYVFKNFHVTIWTAGAKDYADFVYKNIIKPVLPYEMGDDLSSHHSKRKIKNIFYDIDCNESQEKFSTVTVKDLRYLYDLSPSSSKEEKYYPCSTIIIDDRPEVLKVNMNNTIKIPAFFTYKEKDDIGLLTTIKKLKKIKERYEKKGCVYANKE
jgi:hypothetical protein